MQIFLHKSPSWECLRGAAFILHWLSLVATIQNICKSTNYSLWSQLWEVCWQGYTSTPFAGCRVAHGWSLVMQYSSCPDVPHKENIYSWHVLLWFFSITLQFKLLSMSSWTQANNLWKLPREFTKVKFITTNWSCSKLNCCSDSTGIKWLYMFLFSTLWSLYAHREWTIQHSVQGLFWGGLFVISVITNTHINIYSSEPGVFITFANMCHNRIFVFDRMEKGFWEDVIYSLTIFILHMRVFNRW